MPPTTHLTILPHFDQSAPQLSFPNNRGKKFDIMMRQPTLLPLSPQPRPHICAPIAEDPYFQVSFLKLTTGSEATHPVYMAAGPNNQDDDRTYEDDVHVAELLQPATSLDDFMHKVDMFDLVPAHFLTKINQSVMDMVNCESQRQVSILKFLKCLDTESQASQVHKSTRDAGFLGASNEIMAQFQDISLGLAHLKHQQQFLWNIITEKAAPDRDQI